MTRTTSPFQQVNSSAAGLGTDRCHLAVVLAWTWTASAAFEHQATLLHQPADTLGVDQSQTIGSPLALEERGDPPIAVRRALVDQAPNIDTQFAVPGWVLQAALRTRTLGCGLFAPWQPRNTLPFKAAI